MLSDGIIKELGGVVGDENVLTDDESRVCYSFDATRYSSKPDVVVKPRDTEEVARVVALAYGEQIPVTPRGAGTGLSGGSVPAAGGIVLSTERMNSAPQVHKEDLYAIAQPGVVTEQFQAAVEAKDLFYPPDPASQSVCTLGGNVGECAGGLRGLKYGTTRNYILGLEVVTPEGRIVRTGARTVKSVAGYDVTRLMVGSEGTLGVVTSITLRLLPLPPVRRAVACLFEDIAGAAEAASEIIADGCVPSVLELMDHTTVGAVESYLKESIGGRVLLLAEFDGVRSLADEEASRALAVLKGKSGVLVDGQVESERAELLWRARRSALPALTRIAPTVVLEDVTVPRSKLRQMIQSARKAAGKYEIRIAVFGHAGDGNLHPTFLIDRRDSGQVKRLDAAISEIMGICIDLGGTVSGEHGIGIDKMPFLKLELGEAGYEIMRRLKASLDPRGIMNPGKMFYE
jgi:glycolate oxidase